MRKELGRNRKGQGLTEYIVIVGACEQPILTGCYEPL